MMILVCWNLARGLLIPQREMTRLANAFSRGGTRHHGVGTRGFWTPALDIYEGGGTIAVIAKLSGSSKDDVQVEIDDNWLTLKGERKHRPDVDEAKYHRVERVYGTFQRSIGLPYSDRR
jgi:HSP20 family protein